MPSDIPRSGQRNAALVWPAPVHRVSCGKLFDHAQAGLLRQHGVVITVKMQRIEAILKSLELLAATAQANRVVQPIVFAGT